MKLTILESSALKLFTVLGRPFYKLKFNFLNTNRYPIKMIFRVVHYSGPNKMNKLDYYYNKPTVGLTMAVA